LPDDPALADLFALADADDPASASRLFAALYRELHSLAERELRRANGLTLGTTTLLHEAYLKLANGNGARFTDRSRFLAYAARAMRTLTIDYARRQRAHKRGGEFHLVALDGPNDVDAAATPDIGTLEDLGEALETLAAAEAGLAEVVDLHFFCGLSLGEIAAIRGVSERTVQRDWRRARLLLHRSLGTA
jgi:RNA polymerase sigma factor (TIGR02999 family)